VKKKKMKKNYLSLVVLILALTVFSLAVGNAAAEVNSTTAPEGFIPAEVATPRIAAVAEVLLIKDVTPWDVNGNELALRELGKTYSVIPSADLATTDLSEYRIVIIASDQTDATYANLVLYKGKLANYVQNGGVLVAHACDHGWHYGDWTISWLPLGVTKVNTLQEYLSIIDSTSPIVTGTPHGGPVSDADLDNWHYSTHGYFTGLPASVNKIIGITGDPGTQPTYIEYTYGSGTVLATMQTMEWPWKHNPTKAKKDLLRNEIEYAQEKAQKFVVAKDYRYTDVCFEKDNDLEVDCPYGTDLGRLLPTDADGNYIVEAVVKNGKVKSYNPGQYYAVSTVNVLKDVDELVITEDWSDCTGISALNPKQGGGCVVIVQVGPDGVAYQILDAKSDEVLVDVSGGTATATLGAVSAGTTILMYVKFGPAQKHDDFVPGTCENTNTAWVSIDEWESDKQEASAMLELIKKE
jgi:hypothetical protein